MNRKKEGISFKEGNIGLVLNSYESIFSNFDPRSFSQKAISVDFIGECKRASKDKELGLKLILFMPKLKRNLSDETKIKKRLRNHFQRHFILESREIGSIKREGLSWCVIGIVIMLASTLLYRLEGFLLDFLFILSEPAGWFTFWEGLGKIFIEAKHKKPELDFYRKMARADIIFTSY